MRHGVVSSTLGRMVLLVVHAVAVAALLGLSLVVQLVVYPSFRLVGPTDAWPAFHEAHSRGMALAVGPPWAVQGITTAALLVDRPDGVALWLVLLAAELAAATVLLTVLGAVPQHQRLLPYEDARAVRLGAVHRWRTAAWLGGTAVAAAMVITAHS